MHSKLPRDLVKLTIIQQHQIIRLEGVQLNISIVSRIFALLLHLLVESNQK